MLDFKETFLFFGAAAIIAAYFPVRADDAVTGHARVVVILHHLPYGAGSSRIAGGVRDLAVTLCLPFRYLLHGISNALRK